MEEEFGTTNIHIEWLKNIYNELKLIQDMERIAREGCRDLMEYLQIPLEHQRIIMPDAQYKNLRFLTMEMDILINNLSPVLKAKTEKYKERLKVILNNVDNRKLFLQEKKVNNQLVGIVLLPFFYTTINFLISIKSEIINDIGHILYLPEEEKKKW